MVMVAANGLSKLTAVKYGAAVGTAAPYVRKLMRDETLRDDLRELLRLSGKIYESLSGEMRDKELVRRLVDDVKLHAEIEKAVNVMRDAAEHVQHPRTRRSRVPRVVWFAIGAGAVAVVFLNPKTGPKSREVVGSQVTRLRGVAGGGSGSAQFEEAQAA